MRYSATAFGIAIGVAFTAGLLVSPLTRFAPHEAHSQTATALTPQMIDLAGMKHADIPTTALPEMNSKMLVVTDNATVGIQSGNVGKHMHPKTDEIQYIIEGSGSMWLGNERKDFKPGTLLIIPMGTAHQGQIVTSGPVKSIAIKIPPQAPDDTTFVD